MLPIIVALLLSGGDDVPSTQSASNIQLRVELLDSRNFLTRSKEYFIRLQIANNTDKARWVILPFAGEDPMPPKGVFVNEELAKQPFEGVQFKGDGGSPVEVRMSETFYAFRLAPKVELEFDRYCVFATEEIDGIEAMEAEELLVNNKIPLETWVPFGVVCDKSAKVRGEDIRTGWKNLNFDDTKFKTRDDFPKVPVEKVVASKFRTANVRFSRR